ncbi:DUF2243 domain-containing protein [Methylopila sp. Yamaguchi]|uniref:DUF2243 domain-containing protein n=1 Tax=Methylopila sp. Yamaguchi TaxID=1437817 RepID=UPI000CCC78D4|nr:DUF2243 domain-containing protein [Methylopila sp. Yamaguchi]
MDQDSTGPRTSAGVLLGLGLGGFFDGIVLHQLLQWHHMASSWRPVNDVQSLEFNTTLDGAFHAATYIFIVVGVVLLWRDAARGRRPWSLRRFVGCLLCGFGAFNLVEGTINHHILGLHHVNETAPPAHWPYWDIGFLIWGAAMAFAGFGMMRQGRRRAGSGSGRQV